MTARTTLLGCALAASLLGCGPPSECSVLVQAIAPRLARIKQMQSSSAEAPPAADLRATSAAYNELADVTKQLVIADTPLHQLADQVHTSAFSLAVGYTALADALDSGDLGKLSRAKTDLDRGAKQERQSMQKLEGICVRP